MGEQGGLRTGWLAAFGTEGYEGEPPLLEELGVNFGHIKSKVFIYPSFYFFIFNIFLPWGFLFGEVGGGCFNLSQKLFEEGRAGQISSL
jgi:hypothetical protein